MTLNAVKKANHSEIVAKKKRVEAPVEPRGVSTSEDVFGIGKHSTTSKTEALKPNRSP
jgi:hypothetical protein